MKPGPIPKKVRSRPVTRLYVAGGGAVWEEQGKPPVRLSAPAELLLDGGETDKSLDVTKETPNWITRNPVSDKDMRAALWISQVLPADRPASLRLMELTEARQIENRCLAARCLGYLGQFDSMTTALNNKEFHREWFDYVEQLREAIARGPETAVQIRQSLEKQYMNDAPALYRMLWGYTDKDLEDGDDARLVKCLDHELPVFRVLAFWNLRDITHQGLSYQPEVEPAPKRFAAVQRWQRQLETGRIRSSVPAVKPRIPPAPLPKNGVSKAKPLVG